jgi:(R,R)-butanediol dehydrogenase/meso-butanediol dehydrogenase/diacetyl reductase
MEGPYIINQTQHPLTGLAAPLIVGHEYGGIIDAVGNAASNAPQPGTQVAVLPLISCGTCQYCQHGQEDLCDAVAYHGLLGVPGGFAEYSCVNSQNVIPIADRSLLTFIEPILVAIHTGRKVQQQLSSGRVLIMGGGAIGLAVHAVFRDYFHANVIGTEILPQRLQRAVAAGFTMRTKEELEGSYDIVVDCAGSNPLSTDTALLEGFSYLRKGGTLVAVGTYFHPISIVPSVFLTSEYQILTSFLYNSIDVTHLSAVLTTLHADFSQLIETISLHRIIEDGYYRAEVDKDSFTRLVVRC